MMLRLLWKEWIEIRLFLLGLLAAPVFSMLVLKEKYGFSTRVEDGNVTGMGIPWIELVFISIWAASRFPGEMARARFSVFSLPVPRGKILEAKFLPGLAAVILTPAWAALLFWLIAPHRFGSPAAVEWLFPKALELLPWYLSAYCVAFSVSLYSNTAIGTVFGFLAGVYGWVVLQMIAFAPLGEWANQFLYGLLSSRGLLIVETALAQMCRMLFCSALLAFMIVIPAVVALSKSVTPSPKRRAVWGIGVSALILTPFVILYLSCVPRSPVEPSPAVTLLPSPDGQRVAMTTGYGGWGSKPGVAVLNLSDGETRELLVGHSADLIAWSRDSRSLYVQTRSQGPAGSNILRVDERGKIYHVALLPPEKDDGWSTLRERGRVTPNGRYLVVLEKPRYGIGNDLWSIDLKTGAKRVLVANASYLRPDWDLLSNDSMILPSYEEIALDGSGMIREWRFQ